MGSSQSGVALVLALALHMREPKCGVRREGAEPATPLWLNRQRSGVPSMGAASELAGGPGLGVLALAHGEGVFHDQRHSRAGCR